MSLRVPVDRRYDHITGRNNAPLTLVEYGDFECPYCGEAYYELHEVLYRMRDDLQFVFRHFPLTQIHPHAMAAAETAEAAGVQGEFWKMHGMLFENQDRLERANLLSYAHELALDVEAVEAALDTHQYVPHIRDNFSGGVRSGVNGTPSLFINGRRHDGAWDSDTLVATLERELREHDPRALHL